MKHLLVAAIASLTAAVGLSQLPRAAKSSVEPPRFVQASPPSATPFVSQPSVPAPAAILPGEPHQTPFGCNKDATLAAARRLLTNLEASHAPSIPFSCSRPGDALYCHYEQASVSHSSAAEVDAQLARSAGGLNNMLERCGL